MILCELIDFCLGFTFLTLWINDFSCTVKCNDFYGFKSLKFYDITHKEENAIFIDVAVLKQYDVSFFYPSGYSELNIVLS